MTVRDHTDAELVVAAQRGDQGAFAALLHRHAATLVAAGDPDRPVRSLQRTGCRAMRRLADAPNTDVEAWLVSLVDGAGTDTAGVELDPADLDAAWRRIARCWPHGHGWRRRPPPAAVWVMTIVAVMVSSVALPWLLLRVSTDSDELQQLRAFPIEEQRQAAEDPDPAEESLPVFEFPTPPEDEPPAPSPTPPTPDLPEDPDLSEDADEPDGESNGPDDEGDGSDPGSADEDDTEDAGDGETAGDGESDATAAGTEHTGA